MNPQLRLSLLVFSLVFSLVSSVQFCPDKTVSGFARFDDQLFRPFSFGEYSFNLAPTATSGATQLFGFTFKDEIFEENYAIFQLKFDKETFGEDALGLEFFSTSFEKFELTLPVANSVLGVESAFIIRINTVRIQVLIDGNEVFNSQTYDDSGASPNFSFFDELESLPIMMEVYMTMWLSDESFLSNFASAETFQAGSLYFTFEGEITSYELLYYFYRDTIPDVEDLNMVTLFNQEDLISTTFLAGNVLSDANSLQIILVQDQQLPHLESMWNVFPEAYQADAYLDLYSSFDFSFRLDSLDTFLGPYFVVDLDVVHSNLNYTLAFDYNIRMGDQSQFDNWPVDVVLRQKHFPYALLSDLRTEYLPIGYDSAVSIDFGNLELDEQGEESSSNYVDYAQLVLYLGPYGFEDLGMDFTGTTIDMFDIRLTLSCYDYVAPDNGNAATGGTGGQNVGGGVGGSPIGGGDKNNTVYVTEGWEERVKRASTGFGIILVLLIALFLVSAAAWVMLAKKTDKMEMERQEMLKTLEALEKNIFRGQEQVASKKRNNQSQPSKSRLMINNQRRNESIDEEEEEQEDSDVQQIQPQQKYSDAPDAYHSKKSDARKSDARKSDGKSRKSDGKSRKSEKSRKSDTQPKEFEQPVVYKQSDRSSGENPDSNSQGLNSQKDPGIMVDQEHTVEEEYQDEDY